MKRIYLSTLTACISTLLFAQEKTTTVHTEIGKNGNNSGTFWGQPWVWVLGAAIFILLLVALARGGSRQ
jgi:hypothetical protein